MRLFFKMEIVDETGRVHGHLTREIHEDAGYIGERPVDELRAGLPTFQGAVRMMQVREFRKKLLTEAARLGGVALAEHLEDREGWHDRDRQERVNAQYPTHERYL